MEGELIKIMWDKFAGALSNEALLDDYINMVDSAKKDFPDYNELLKEHNWETPSEFTDAVQKWFEKWFGDGETK